MTEAIKTMKLYSGPTAKIMNELSEGGLNEGKLKPDQLYSMDMMNYYGSSAILEFTKVHFSKGTEKPIKVLDIGSGLGGPARVMASSGASRVVGIEMQPDISALAEDLTQRCDLAGVVKHVAGDFLVDAVDADGKMTTDDPTPSFTHCTSWLVYLHISDKKTLFSRIAGSLLPGGIFYAEDFFKKESFKQDEIESLKTDVFCADLPTRAE